MLVARRPDRVMGRWSWMPVRSSNKIAELMGFSIFIHCEKTELIFVVSFKYAQSAQASKFGKSCEHIWAISGCTMLGKES